MTQHTAFPEREAIDAFRSAIEAAGLTPPTTIVPGSQTDKPRRFHVNDDASFTRNGWYVLFVDGHPAGEFGCYKRGIRQTWAMERGGRELTPQERQEIDERLERARKARDAAERQRQGEAAKIANLLLDQAGFAPDDHPYLVRKGVKSHGLHMGMWEKVDASTGEIWLSVPDALLVPIRGSGGKVVNVQAIFPDKHPKLGRDKDFLANGKKRGGFHMIGNPRAGSPVVICEGYATGASIHEATGLCVIVAFDAGNLVPVAELVRDLMDGFSFIIAGDNDQFTMPEQGIKNPGLHYATEAGRAINCRVVVPQFTSLEGEPTDFNDLHQLEGAQAVVSQLIPVKTIITNVTEDATELVEPDYGPIDRFGLPDLGGKGAVMPTVGNLREICNRLGVVIRYNQITKADEILFPGESFSVDNNARASFHSLENECVLFRMPTEKLRGSIMLLGERNHYNPVVTWVTSKPWDGKDRLPEMFATLTIPDPEKTWLRDALVKRWMISAIAAAFSPDGIAAQGMLVLQGPQDVGKTKWLMSLVPRHLRLAKEGATLNTADRDSIKQALQFWLVELGELDATFRKSDIAALKSFITRESDVFRKAYAADDSHFARRTVFFGSVNPKQFLHDPTGNRRFWSIQVSDVDHIHADLDMQQVWAQILTLHQAGEQFHLTHEEKEGLKGSNEDFQVADPTEERIQTRLEWGMEETHWRWLTVTEVLTAIGIDKPTQSDCTKAGITINKLNGDRSKKSNGRKLVFVPPVSRNVV